MCCLDCDVRLPAVLVASVAFLALLSSVARVPPLGVGPFSCLYVRKSDKIFILTDIFSGVLTNQTVTSTMTGKCRGDPSCLCSKKLMMKKILE